MLHQSKNPTAQQSKSRSDRSTPLRQATVSPTIGNILQLQRMIGNRATMQLLKNAHAMTNQQNQPPIQRFKYRFKPDPRVDVPDLATLETMADNLDVETEKAYKRVVEAIKNRPIKDADFPDIKDNGYYKNWKYNINAMTSGYAIEAIVNKWAEDKAGYESQYATGNARPDFFITDGKHRGVVDITSSKQKGHVWGKEFSKGYFHYIAESIYTSIDFNNLSAGGALSPDDLIELSQIQAKKANQAFRSKLNDLQLVLSLKSMQGLPTEEIYKAVSKVRMKNAFGAAVDRADIEVIDQALENCNLRKISDIITTIQEDYDVAGDPPWR